MLGINTKNSNVPSFPLMSSNELPKAEHQELPVMDSVNERKRDRFPFSLKGRHVQLKSAYSGDNQTIVLKNQDAKKSASET